MYRLIAADMDDTLLAPDSRLTKRTIEALNKAMDAGAYVMLATGRMLESALPFAEETGVNAPLLLYNGAWLYDRKNDKTLFSNVIKKDTAKAICKMAREMGLYIQAYPGKGYYAEKRTAYTDAYAKQIRVDCVITGVPLDEFIDSDCFKLLIIGEKEETPGNIKKFSEAFPEISFMMSKPHYIEIVAKGIDKAATLEAAIAHLGIKREEVLAFGDGQNDLSMLKFAGKGYCMANALESVKAKCDTFAPSNARDGVAQVIEELLEKGEIGR